MELFHLHTIFEFFLVLYAGYMVSNEIKSVIDQKVIKLLKGYTNLISKTKSDLLEIIASSIEACDLMENITTDDARKLTSYINKKRDKLEQLKSEISKKYDGSDPNILFESETQFTNVFKPYSFYFTIYCFLLLFINGYPPLSTDNGFYEALLVFNCLSSLFLAIIFISSLFSSITLGNGWILLIFTIFLSISIWVFRIYTLTDEIESIKNVSIIFSVVLVIFPILLYMLRIQFSGPIFKTRIATEFSQYSSKITVVKDEIQNPLNFSAAFAEFNKMKKLDNNLTNSN